MFKDEDPIIAKFKALLNSQLFAFFLIFLIFWLGYDLVKVIEKKVLLEKQAKNLQAEIIQIKKRSDELKKMLSSLENPTEIEKEARTRLNLEKQGEKLVIIIMPINAGVATSSLKQKSSAFFLSKIINWFRFIFRVK